MSLRREFQLIDRIHALLKKPSKRVLLGIGDDAAVTEPPKGKLLSTVDMLVEGIHFDLGYTEPRELGHKALAVNLSDIAAMGGRPLYALVSLGLRAEAEAEFVELVYEGMRELALKYGVDIVGGNIVESPERLLVDVVLLGEPSGKIFERKGARVGDVVAVTGPLGSSAAGLHWLRALGNKAREIWPESCRAHLLPEPRLFEAEVLAGGRTVTAGIDISDGLGSELHHLARQSGVGFSIDELRLPISEETKRGARETGLGHLGWALYGGRITSFC